MIFDYIFTDSDSKNLSYFLDKVMARDLQSGQPDNQLPPHRRILIDVNPFMVLQGTFEPETFFTSVNHFMPLQNTNLGESFGAILA